MLFSTYHEQLIVVAGFFATIVLGILGLWIAIWTYEWHERRMARRESARERRISLIRSI